MSSLPRVERIARRLEAIELRTLRQRCERLHAENAQLVAEVSKLQDLARWQSEQLLELTEALHERGERVGITRGGHIGVVASPA